MRIIILFFCLVAGILARPSTVNDDALLKRNVSSRNAQISSLGRWPNGIIPYVFTTQSDKTKANFAIAVDQLNKASLGCITFKPRTNEQLFLTVVDGGGCSCSMGRGYKPTMTLQEGTFCQDVKTILHEMGHAVGFDHEHNQPKRDDYLDIDYGNIMPEIGSSPWKKLGSNEATTYGFKFDFYSIMNYQGKAGAVDTSKNVISTKDTTMQGVIGEQDKLSTSDVCKILNMYLCTSLPFFTEKCKNW